MEDWTVARQSPFRLRGQSLLPGREVTQKGLVAFFPERIERRTPDITIARAVDPQHG